MALAITEALSIAFWIFASRTFDVIVEDTGQLKVRMTSAAGTFAVTSCKLLQPARTAAAQLVITWGKENLLKLEIGSSLVASNLPSDVIPSEFTFKQLDEGVIPHDFAQENEAARFGRRATMVSIHPKHGRQRAEDEYIFRGLETGLLQVKELLVHIERGRTHHADGLSGLVRNYIADGKQRVGRPFCNGVRQYWMNRLLCTRRQIRKLNFQRFLTIT